MDFAGRHLGARSRRTRQTSHGTTPTRCRARRGDRTDSQRTIRRARAPCSRHSRTRTSQWSMPAVLRAERIRKVRRLREPVRADPGPPRRRRPAASSRTPTAPRSAGSARAGQAIGRSPPSSPARPGSGGPRPCRRSSSPGPYRLGFLPTSRSHCPCVISYFDRKNGSSRTSVIGDSLSSASGSTFGSRRRLIVVGLDRAHPERAARDQHEHDAHRLGHDELAVLVPLRDRVGAGRGGLEVRELPEARGRVLPDRDQPELRRDLEAAVLGALGLVADRSDRVRPLVLVLADRLLLHGLGEREAAPDVGEQALPRDPDP